MDKERKVFIYDTTLRDGAQGEGISLTVEDKLKITKKLRRLFLQADGADVRVHYQRVKTTDGATLP